MVLYLKTLVIIIIFLNTSAVIAKPQSLRIFNFSHREIVVTFSQPQLFIGPSMEVACLTMPQDSFFDLLLGEGREFTIGASEADITIRKRNGLPHPGLTEVINPAVSEILTGKSKTH